MVCFLIAFITVQQVCALAALTISGKAKIPSVQPIWNGFLQVTMKVLNSYLHFLT